MRAELIIILFASLTLSACGGTGGRVTSDIPGVAEGLMNLHRSNITPGCQAGETGTVTARATTNTTRVGLQRETFQYQLTCTKQ